MRVALRSGVVALVATAVAAGVVAVTGASAEPDPSSPPTVTTTAASDSTPAAKPAPSIHAESQIGFTCAGDARAVLVEVRSTDPHAAAAAMSAEIGAPVLVVDTDACELQRSPYGAPALQTWWVKQFAPPASDLFVGQFSDVGDACEVELAVFQKLVAANEGLLSGAYRHVRVAPVGRRAPEPTDCVDVRKWTSLARGARSESPGPRTQVDEKGGN